jgi:hypothetical protein
VSKKRDCVRIHPYVDRALVRRLAGHAAAKGDSESAVVESALRCHLDGEDTAVTQLLQRLDRLGRANERLHRDIELLSEAFAIWVQLWFAYGPSIDHDGKDFARRTAASRYAQFVEHLAHQYQSGQGLLRDLSALRLEGDSEPAPKASPPPTEAGTKERTS